MSRKKQTINVGLLIDTVSVQSVSHDDSRMHNYIKQYVTSQGYSYTEDTYGNIYVTKGQGPYVAFVAHTDTVHNIIKDYRVYKSGDTIFAFNGITGKQYGTGGDDKVGVFCNLQALNDFRNVKLAFFRNEEVGCLGSGQANIPFFDDCNFVVQFDRRGNSDLITSVGGVNLCSSEFIKAIKPYTDAYKYKETYGLSTDVATLKRRGLAVSAINLSCGYHNPHTDSEIIRISEVDNVYKMVKQIVLNLGNTKFEHTYKAPKYEPFHTTGRTFNMDGSLDDDDTYNHSYYARWNRSSYLFNRFVTINKRDTKSFRFVGMEPLELPVATCPICKKNNDIVCFLPNELEFYCVDCNCYITNPSTLFKELVVEDDSFGSKVPTRFVFNWVNACWHKETDAVWVTTLNTYMLKESVT